MATRRSYVHNSIETYSGASRRISFMQFSQNIDGFQTKWFTGLLELIQLYKQNPLEKILIFTIYQNYTLAVIDHAPLSPLQGSQVRKRKMYEEFLTKVSILGKNYKFGLLKYKRDHVCLAYMCMK